MLYQEAQITSIMPVGQLLAFILASYGIANIIVFAAVVDKPRKYLASLHPFIAKLLGCIMCVGFWVGFFLAFSGLGPFSCYNPGAMAVLADAAIGSASSWLIYLLTAEKLVGK